MRVVRHGKKSERQCYCGATFRKPADLKRHLRAEEPPREVWTGTEPRHLPNQWKNGR